MAKSFSQILAMFRLTQVLVPFIHFLPEILERESLDKEWRLWLFLAYDIEGGVSK